MAVNTAYRHGDYPVAVNGVFAIRVQDVAMDKNTPITDYKEMGNFGSVGAQQDTSKFTGSLRWFPINNQMESLLAGYTTSGSTINLSALVNSGAGVPIKTLKTLIEGCKVTSLEYSCQANGEFTATANFGGTEWKAGSAIVATTPSGQACYKSKDVMVSVGGVTGVRVSGVSFRTNVPSNDLIELNNANAVATVQDAPTVTAEIDFYESDLMAGNVEATLAVPKDIIVTVGGASILRYTLKNMVSGPAVQNQRGNVGGWATRKYAYMLGAYDASYGLIIDKTA
jgi:hypothetical protein